jgi:hypothetical protein
LSVFLLRNKQRESCLIGSKAEQCWPSNRNKHHKIFSSVIRSKYEVKIVSSKGEHNITAVEPGSKEPALLAVRRTGSHWVSSYWKILLFSDVAWFMLNGNVNIHKTDIVVPIFLLQCMKFLYVILNFEFGVQQMWTKSPGLHFILNVPLILT